MVVLPRWSLYVQGLLIAVAGLVGLVLGYAMGRGGASQRPGGEPAEPVPVLIEAKVVYVAAPGELANDGGAVLIALPAQRRPERTLSIAGLKPQDPPPATNAPAVRAIVDFGGLYERADAEGNVALRFPDQGVYFLLIISRHSRRPEQQPIDKQHLAEARRYFFLASELIGSWDYRWMPVTIGEHTRRLQCTFAPDGRAELLLD